MHAEMQQSSNNNSNSTEYNPANMLGPVFNNLQPERPCSPDVTLGAYLISHLNQICENCGVTETPQWRKGWYSNVLQHTVLLCNKCGLKYMKNQFCPYCMYVYYKEEDKKPTHTPSANWLVCDSCTRWVHTACENKYGIPQPNHQVTPMSTSPPDSNFALNSFAHQQQQQPQHHSYHCPGCRASLQLQQQQQQQHNHAKQIPHQHGHHHNHPYHTREPRTRMTSYTSYDLEENEDEEMEVVAESD